MKKLAFSLILVLVLAAAAFGQHPPIQYGRFFKALYLATDPTSAACINGTLVYSAASNSLFICEAGAWNVGLATIPGVLPVASGGTGLASGTSGGILAYTANGVLASSAALGAGQFVLGGGAGAVPATTFSIVTVAKGGTALASGTSGGVLGYTAVGTLASSAALAAGQFVLGGGAGATPTTSFSIVPTANGGTGIAFFTAAGPTVARIYTFPDAATTILTTNAAVTLAQGGTGLAQTGTQQITTNGTAVTAGTCQAQPAATITGVTTTSAAMWSVPTVLPATWQTGIFVMPVVTTNTVTLSLCNGTAGSITPVGQLVNVKAIL